LYSAESFVVELCDFPHKTNEKSLQRHNYEWQAFTCFEPAYHLSARSRRLFSFTQSNRDLWKERRPAAVNKISPHPPRDQNKRSTKKRRRATDFYAERLVTSRQFDFSHDAEMGFV
jgi:hypothetical protein